jgi:hypothetical protein
MGVIEIEVALRQLLKFWEKQIILSVPEKKHFSKP